MIRVTFEGETREELERQMRDFLGEPKRKIIPDVPIDGLEWSTRTHRLLSQMQITTLEELTCYSAKEFLAVKGFGARSLREVREMLDNWGLHLRGEES